MEKDVEIAILPDGTIRFVYTDELKPLLKAGEATVNRVSHVDPIIHEGDLQWFADLSPVKGPKLGPFPTRDDAIAAELKWLSDNLTVHPEPE